MGNSYPEDYCIEEKNSFLGSHTGIAKLMDDEEAELTWSNKVVLAPGEMARLSVTTVNDCNPNLVRFDPFIAHESCPPGTMIFELGTDNTGFSNTTYGSDIGIKPGQGFHVYENAENGTVIGELASYAARFFSLDEYKGPIYLVNALPGTPFSVDTDGMITVANSAALDYEQTKSFTLKVQADYVNRDTQVVEVIVHINNRNDMAPEETQEIATIEAKVDELVNASISTNFIDGDGDGITFSSINLPTGLTLSKSGLISGALQTAGDFQADIIASDGINKTSAILKFTVLASSKASIPATTPTADSSASSGGSTGILFMLFTSIALVNRRARQ
jgi:hypothetical protein